MNVKQIEHIRDKLTSAILDTSSITVSIDALDPDQDEVIHITEARKKIAASLSYQNQILGLLDDNLILLKEEE